MRFSRSIWKAGSEPYSRVAAPPPDCPDLSAAGIRGVVRRRGPRPALVAALLALPLLAGVAPEAGAQTVATLSIEDATLAEGEGERYRSVPGGESLANVTLMRFTVRLSAPQPHQVRVMAKTRNASPASARGGRRITAQRDYLRARLQADFYPGQTVAHLWVQIVDDSREESDETFELVLYEPQGAEIEDGLAVGTIVDDDQPFSEDNQPLLSEDNQPLPEIAVSAGSAVDEGGDAVFTITASPAPASPLTVTYTISADGDFGVDSTGGRSLGVTVPVTGSRTLTLTTENDDVDEPDGSVSVTVAAGDGYTVGGRASGTVAVRDDDDPLPEITVADDDRPRLSVEDSELREPSAGDESSFFVMDFVVRLSRPSPSVVSVRVGTRDSSPVSAEAGKDYMPKGGRVHFPAGETVRRVGVVVLDDDHDEGSETFELALWHASNEATIGDGVAVGTIVNDDPMPAAWLRAMRRIRARASAPRRGSSPAVHRWRAPSRPALAGRLRAVASRGAARRTPAAARWGCGGGRRGRASTAATARWRWTARRRRRCWGRTTPGAAGWSGWRWRGAGARARTAPPGRRRPGTAPGATRSAAPAWPRPAARCRRR